MGEIAKILFDYAKRITDSLDKLEDNLKADAKILSDAIQTETVEYCEEISPATIKYSSDCLTVPVKTEICRSSIDIVSYYVAQIFAEHYIKSGRLEDGSPVSLLNKIISISKNDNHFSFYSLGLIPSITRNMLRYDYEQTSARLSNDTGAMAQMSKDVEAKVRENIELLKSSNQSLDDYKTRFTELRSAINFTLLGKAFCQFISNKEDEKKKMFNVLIGLSILILAVPILLCWYSVEHKAWPETSEQGIVQKEGLSQTPALTATNNKPELVKRKETSRTENDDIAWKYVLERLFILLPITIAELILLFYFKVVLVHYNSAGAQLLQLQTRLAVCQFIEDFIKFKKETNVNELDKFEALIFSNLMPSADQIPPTFDGLEQLGKILGEFKPKV